MLITSTLFIFLNATKSVPYLGILHALFLLPRSHFKLSNSNYHVNNREFIRVSFTHIRVNLQTVIKLRNVRRNPSSSRSEIENWRAVRQRLNWARYSFDRNLRDSRIILSLSLPPDNCLLPNGIASPNTRVGEA